MSEAPISVAHMSTTTATLDSQLTLDETSTRMLAFEKRWWKLAGAKESAIRREFGVSVTRYYQKLNRLLDDPAALAAEPGLVMRLWHLRD